MTSFKFVHTADIHLDSPLRGLSRYEGVPVEQVRLATRAALNNLVDFSIEEAVAFVVIAGDLFDGEWDDFSTGLYFCGAMRRLKDAGIEVYVVFGNHDAESVQTKRLPLPDNVKRFSAKAAETLIHESSGAALHGQSYKSRDPGCDLSSTYPAPVPARFNIGVLHTALEGGRPPHAPYSPCTPAQLAAKGYDYWALGHVHTHEIIRSGTTQIVFPGNLQGRNIRECGPKGALLVTVEDTSIAGIEFVPLDAVRWANLQVDVTTCGDLLAIERRVGETLAAALETHAGGRPLVVRVTLKGATALHGDLAQRLSILREEVRALATTVSDQLWIEKVRLATVPAAEEGAIVDADELAGLLGEGVSDEGMRALLTQELEQFFGRAPPDLAEDSELLGAARAGSLDQLLQDAAAAVKARLADGVG